MSEALSIRDAAAALITKIDELRAAFLANQADLELKQRGFAITDALGGLKAAASKPAQILPLLEAVIAAHKVLGAPGHYGYSHPIGKALKGLYDAHGKLAAAIDTERALEGGAA